MVCDGCNFCERILKDDGRPLPEFRIEEVRTPIRVKRSGDKILVAPTLKRLYHDDKLLYVWGCTCALHMVDMLQAFR